MSVGDRAERADVGAGRLRRTMVELRPSGRSPWKPIFFGLVVICASVAGIVLVQRGDKNVQSTFTEGTPAVAMEPTREPAITMTLVSPGIFHFDFDGWFCNDTSCLKRVFGMVREQAPNHRIVDVKPLGEYGSPTALIVITEPVP